MTPPFRRELRKPQEAYLLLLLTMSLFSSLLQAVLLLAFVAVAHQAWLYITSPIKHIPGPFAAKFTNLWRLFDVWGGRPDLTHVLLHEKHGSAVRVGPDLVSLSDPSLMHKIYDSRGKFQKVSW